MIRNNSVIPESPSWQKSLGIPTFTPSLPQRLLRLLNRWDIQPISGALRTSTRDPQRQSQWIKGRQLDLHLGQVEKPSYNKWSWLSGTVVLGERVDHLLSFLPATAKRNLLKVQPSNY